MILTKKIFDSAASNRGGYTVKQLVILGEKRTTGWKNRIIGKDFKESVIIEFLIGRREEARKRRKNSKQTKCLKHKDFSFYKKKFTRVNGNISYKDQLKHVNWKIVRLFVLRRDNYKCVKCGSKSKSLHIHHTKYVGKYAWDTPPEFLQTLCKTCHEFEHNPELLEQSIERAFNKQ
jgi:5-methylcytosine-specific restriction endonuclease McrA